MPPLKFIKNICKSLRYVICSIDATHASGMGRMINDNHKNRIAKLWLRKKVASLHCQSTASGLYSEDRNFALLRLISTLEKGEYFNCMLVDVSGERYRTIMVLLFMADG